MLPLGCKEGWCGLALPACQASLTLGQLTSFWLWPHWPLHRNSILPQGPCPDTVLPHPHPHDCPLGFKIQMSLHQEQLL